MKKVSYISALILIAGWAVGYFSRAVGSAVHYLLAAALVLILISVIRDNNTNHKNINQP